MPAATEDSASPSGAEPIAARRRPTLQDVAARAGVSRAMASIVLRDARGASASTRARVLAVAEELGYRADVPARLLARQRARLIGVTAQLGHPFHADLVAGIYEAAERCRYDIVLGAAVPGRDERRVVDSLLGYRSEALVLVAPDLADGALAELGRRIPLAVVGRRVDDRQVHVIRTADDLGVETAVEHLIGLGHTRIAHLDGGSLPSAQDRRRGYRTAMRRRRLAAWVVSGGQTEDDGARGARELMAAGLPTAVVCYNDRCAVGLLDVLIRAGLRVPDDVSVVGFDDSQLARLSHIDLTSVAQDVARMADLAVTALVTSLERPAGGADEPEASSESATVASDGPARACADGSDGGVRHQREAVLPPRLVVRSSTGRPAAGPGPAT